MARVTVLRGCVLAVALAVVGSFVQAETTGAASPPAANDFRTEFKDSLTDVPDLSELSAKGMVYVPAYSRVNGAGTRKLIELTTTLRIDNTSETKPLVIERIEYYDTAGKLVQSYLKEPVALRPFGSVEIVIPSDDIRGGVAGNFVIAWAGSGPIAQPLVEAVMIGTQDNTSYSFVSQGRPIRPVGHSSWPQFKFRF